MMFNLLSELCDNLYIGIKITLFLELRTAVQVKLKLQNAKVYVNLLHCESSTFSTTKPVFLMEFMCTIIMNVLLNRFDSVTQIPAFQN